MPRKSKLKKKKIGLMEGRKKLNVTEEAKEMFATNHNKEIFQKECLQQVQHV